MVWVLNGILGAVCLAGIYWLKPRAPRAQASTAAGPVDCKVYPVRGDDGRLRLLLSKDDGQTLSVGVADVEAWSIEGRP